MDRTKSERLKEWATDKDNEDLVSTALIEYADFCKKLTSPDNYLACKQEILKRLKANKPDKEYG